MKKNHIILLCSIMIWIATASIAGTFIDETFEGPGYVETWSETNGSGRITDDATSPTPPAGQGTYCLVFDKNDAQADLRTTASGHGPNQEVYIRMYVRIDSTNLPAGERTDIGGVLAYDTYAHFGIMLRNVSGTYRIVPLVRTAQWDWVEVDTSPAINLDTWYRLEFYCNSQSHYVEARLDGVEYCNNHSIPDWYDEGGFRAYRFGFSEYPSSLRLTFQVDGFAVSDSTWIGGDAPDTVAVLHIGDSQLSGEPSGSDSLQIQFGAYSTPPYSTYAKRGIGGQTTGQIRARLVANINQYNPTLVVYDGGANDWSLWDNSTWTWPQMFDTIITNLSWIDSVSRARTDSVPVYIPLPPAEADGRAPYYKRLNVELRKWCRSIGTRWAGWWYELVHSPALDEFAHEWEATDQTHPTPEGSSRIGMLAAGAVVESGTIYADTFGASTYPNPASHSWRNWSLGAGVSVTGNADSGIVTGSGYMYSPVFATEHYDSTILKRVTLRINSSATVDSVAFRISNNNFTYDTMSAWTASRYPARDTVRGRYCQYRLYTSSDAIDYVVWELSWMHIDSIRPSSGLAGDTATIYGFGFETGDSVLFRDSAAEIITLSDTLIEVVAPDSVAVKLVGIVVVDADDLSDTLAGAWTYTQGGGGWKNVFRWVYEFFFK